MQIQFSAANQPSLSLRNAPTYWQQSAEQGTPSMAVSSHASHRTHHEHTLHIFEALLLGPMIGGIWMIRKVRKNQQLSQQQRNQKEN